MHELSARLSDLSAHELPTRPRWIAWIKIKTLLGFALSACAVVCVFALAREHPNQSSYPEAKTRAPVAPHSRAQPGELPLLSERSGYLDHSYWPRASGRSLITEGGGIRGVFTSAGATLHINHEWLGLSLAGLGHGARLSGAGPSRPSTTANEVMFHRGGILESYKNGPFGLEQTFAILRPFHGRGALGLSVRLFGSLRPAQEGGSIAFKDATQATILKLDQLRAFDATGRRLPVAMRLRRGMLRLSVDDRWARYPLLIDPFVHDPFVQSGKKLTNGIFTGHGTYFGSSIALSAEGSTALIGDPSDEYGNGLSPGLGAGWVFMRSGTTWMQQGPKLATGKEGGELGAATALSADGNTAALGGGWAFGQDGQVAMYTRSGSTWSLESSLSSALEGENYSNFGVSVALSGDGQTALVGEPSASEGNEGSARVFTHTGTWTRDAKLTVPEGSGAEGSLGRAVALSRDGDVALVGAPGADGGKGAAWIFKRSGDNWSKGVELTVSSSQSFGSAVTLSADGSTALIGAPETRELLGAAWVFTWTGSSWAQTSKLTGVGGTGEAQRFGTSVALDDQADAAIVGAPGDDGNVGTEWVFARTGSVWATTEALLPAEAQPAYEGPGGGGEFGTSSALSADGNVALVGGPSDDEGRGAAWVFTHPLPSITTGKATDVVRSTAQLTADINPHGAATECLFEYGPTSFYGSAAGCSPSPGSSSAPVDVTALIAGLTPNTTYHFRASATNPAGTGYGEDATFHTQPNPPAVATRASSSVSQTYATLNATVNPEGGQVGDCRFEYGGSAAYGASVPCSPSTLSGQSALAVSGAVNVSANTSYRFRVVASNEGGTSYGEDQTFRTPAPPLPQLQATMTWRFSWSKHYTLVRSLIVHGVPAGAHVDVACGGRGCPSSRSHTATAAARKRCHGKRCVRRHAPQGPTVSLAGLFKGRHLAPGARILVSVSKPGWISKGFLFAVRSSGPPKSQIGCFAAGAKAPGVGC